MIINFIHEAMMRNYPLRKGVQVKGRFISLFEYNNWLYLSEPGKIAYFHGMIMNADVQESIWEKRKNEVQKPLFKQTPAFEKELVKDPFTIKDPFGYLKETNPKNQNFGGFPFIPNSNDPYYNFNPWDKKR